MLLYEKSFVVVASWLKQKEKIINNYKKNQSMYMLLIYFLFKCCRRKIPQPNVLQCIICCSNQREKAFGPCNHFLTCAECSKNFKTCPICLVKVDEIFNIYY